MATPMLHRFTTDDYAHLREAGVLIEDDRVELIDGEVIAMSPIGSSHAGTVNELSHVLNHKLHGKAIVSIQNPIYLSEHDEPQPDVAVLQFRDDFYRGSLPKVSDILLLIEVADTSRDFDRNEKIPRYAAAGVAESWLVDLTTTTVEQYSGPQDGAYPAPTILQPGDSVTVQHGLNIRMEVAEIFR